MAIPTVSSAVISDGTLSITWSENVTYLTGSPTLVCTDRLHSITSITFSSMGAIDLITGFEFPEGSIFEGETVTLTVPAGLVEAQSGGQANAAASGLATTNNSDHTDAAACDGVAAGLMVNRCMILRPTESQSASSGAISTTWSVWKYPVCCNIQAAGTSEGFAQAMEDADANYNAFFPASLAIKPNDRVCLITGGGVQGLSGKILEVVGRPIDHAGRGAYRFVPLRAVEGNDG